MRKLALLFVALVGLSISTTTLADDWRGHGDRSQGDHGSQGGHGDHGGQGDHGGGPRGHEHGGPGWYGNGGHNGGYFERGDSFHRYYHGWVWGFAPPVWFLPGITVCREYTLQTIVGYDAYGNPMFVSVDHVECENEDIWVLIR
jgi:hypothetical protein